MHKILEFSTFGRIYLPAKVLKIAAKAKAMKNHPNREVPIYGIFLMVQVNLGLHKLKL